MTLKHNVSLDYMRGVKVIPAVKERRRESGRRLECELEEEEVKVNGAD